MKIDRNVNENVGKIISIIIIILVVNQTVELERK